MADKHIDLSGLAIDRSSPAFAGNGATDGRRWRGRWLSRYAIPGLIMMGFVGLIVVSAGSSLSPTQSVTVVPVIVKRGIVQQAGTPLFQAAGWIEPRPTAINVASLTSGVLESLDVVEGELVEQDQPIARLVSIDAELAVQQAHAALEIQEGALKRAEAELVAAKVRFEQPLHLKIQLADAKSLLAKAKTEINRLPFLIRSAEARASFAEQNLAGKQAAGQSVAERIVQQVESERNEATAQLNELEGKQPLLQNEIDALQDKVDALQIQLQQLTDERQRLSEAEAKMDSAEALRERAKIDLKLAELNLRRTVIRAPVRGRVLRLVALPGTRLSGLDSNGQHDSGTVVEMYDPQKLQVRADVRLEDVPLVMSGGPVQIQTASSGNKIMGRVLRATSLANVQKNTLEVKVELLDPPATVSPEMLVTAMFLTPQNGETSNRATETAGTNERIFVPRQLVFEERGRPHAWIVDAEHRARQVEIVLGQASENGLVEVITGLNLTDKLIASNQTSLRPDMRVAIVGEHETIGIEG